MADVLFVLAIVWGIVTVVGHVSWVIVRAILRVITGTKDLPATRPTSDQDSDLAATRRVILRLAERGMLGSEQADQLRRHLRNLELQQSTGAIHPAASPWPASSQPDTADASAPFMAEFFDEPAPEQRSPIEAPSTTPAPPVHSPPAPSHSFDAPIAQFDASVSKHVSEASLPVSSVSSPSISSPSISSRSISDSSPPSPSLSRAEVIRSFLEAHNIRWGELVAGMLIVICSIGLVISLWSPLVETHRAVPSLIFLAANAAIYAAGLYTLSRWRLRHTSRAVLVIATLLVPLSVLAGLAAAGASGEAVQLTDPITLGAITIASGVYLCLLFLSGKALVRRQYAIPIIIAVGGPVAILPIVPAAVRTFEGSAGWLLAVGSLLVTAASYMMVRARREGMSFGVAGGRARLLILGLGGYSLAVAAGYIAFMVRSYGIEAYLALAIAAIPAVVALAGLSHVLMNGSRVATQSMTGATLYAILIGLAWTTLPTAIYSQGWFWMWGITLSSCLLLLGWFANQSKQFALSTVPIGLAVVMTSPAWMGGQEWNQISFWRRIIGGEPMISMGLVSLAVGSLAAVFTGAKRRPMEMASAGWVLLLLTTASVLSFSPETLLGAVPGWAVTAILSATALATACCATRWSASAYGTIAATFFTWSSVLRPIGIGQEIAGASVWMMTLSAIGVTFLTLAELIRPFSVWRRTSNPGVTVVASMIWQMSSAAAVIVTGFIACYSVEQSWVASSSYLAVAALVLGWNWTLSRDLSYLRVSQLATTAMAVVVGYGQCEEWLFGRTAWGNGTALWSWSVLTGLVAAGWLVVREAASLNDSNRAFRKRFGTLARPSATPRWMLDGWLIGIQISSLAFGALWAYASLFALALGKQTLQYDAPIWLPAASLALGAAVIGIGRRQERDPEWSDHGVSVLGVTTLLWGSAVTAMALPINASNQVIVATTLVAAAGMVASVALSRKASLMARSWIQLDTAVTAAVITIASATLLYLHWLQPLADGLLADRLPTASVSAWWLASAVGLLWYSKRQNEPVAIGLSAVLTPLAFAILVPAMMDTSRITWIQIAGLASVGWILCARAWLGEDSIKPTRSALIGSSVFVLVIGVGSAFLVTMAMLFDLPWVARISGVPCLLVSTAALALGVFKKLPLPGLDQADSHLSWPMAVSLMSGQVAWLASMLNVASGIELAEITSLVILIGGCASLARYHRLSSTSDFIHVALVGFVVILATSVIGIASDRLPWMALIGTIAVGLLPAIASNHLSVRHPLLIACRLLGWLTIGVGIVLILHRIMPSLGEEVQWTVVVLWTAAWVVAWRILHIDRKRDAEARRAQAVLALPDMEFSGLLLTGLLVETLWITVTGDHRLSNEAWKDPLMWTRALGYLAAAFAGLSRGNRKATWTLLLGSVVMTASMVAAHVSVSFGATDSQRWAFALLPAGFAVALVAHWLIPMSALITRVVGGKRSSHLDHVARSTWQLAVLVTVSGTTATIAMIVASAPAVDAQLSTLSVALTAWAIAVTADAVDRDQLRQLAVFTGLGAVGLLASIDGGQAAEPFLTASMRWLVASLVTAPTLIFLVPKLMSGAMADRWRASLILGAKLTGLAAFGSLVCMLTLEAMLRENGRVPGVEVAWIVVVAIALAALSLLSTLVAVLTSPDSRWRDQLSLTDVQRRVLIVAAQGFAVVTWVHVFLCNCDWAFAGLREHWPYIVMGLAFASVGAVEWARRRQDEVMSHTLSQTSLYLPVIPVVGFWLSGSLANLDWMFAGTIVRYDVLLVLGAIYYLFISAMWKQILPRIAAIVLANAAWWIVLVQQPGWGFLAHPQVWLIPPAACVLVIVHFYRDRLETQVTTAIRYAASLVIYISSTADMLIQQVGSHLSGPIILIVLALLGMLAGVILRVRPFLYLGATFVFLGVISMVWHAHHAFDAAWLWWVFGITMGMLLLAGLMALEKNKPKLRRYAESLASWNG
jgi:hypothetical protein